MNRKHHGSSLDAFLKTEGVFEETQALAVKEVVAWHLSEAMQQRSTAQSLQVHGEWRAQSATPRRRTRV